MIMEKLGPMQTCLVENCTGSLPEAEDYGPDRWDLILAAAQMPAGDEDPTMP
jgi:hypothetical protein